MASVDYIYSVSADTLTGRVNPITLAQQIGSSTITIALDYIDVVGDVLNIWFKAALLGSEQTTLTAVVAAHNGNLGISDVPDTIVAQLTLEGRNLLARSKLGDVVYRQLGWQVGRGGYLPDRPVKVSSFIDVGSQAEGYFEILDNANWDIGTYISLNGKWFVYGTHFVEGLTSTITITNIRNAILDSTDPRHYRVVVPFTDPLYPSRLYIQSLMTGDIGNSYPLLVYNVANINFGVSAMTGGSSAALEDPAYPTVPNLAPYTGNDGLIELPSTTSLSFMSRIGEGTNGIGAYGELGLWVEILDSSFTPEIGGRVLFALSHFPIQPKTDRTISAFRVIISY
jgi:hypothetical protein